VAEVAWRVDAAQDTRAMSSGSQRTRPIALAAIGDVDSELISSLGGVIQAALGRIVVLADGLPIPPHSFSRQRGQWRAPIILDALAGVKRPEWVRLLGVVDVDLYSPELNFVFGEADAHRGVAVFSTARLRVGSAGERQLYRRATTEAIHELGHTFGLGHCARPGCVMWFSNTLTETDRKSPRPCAEHARALARALAAER
jgi:archaemetzincin